MYIRIVFCLTLLVLSSFHTASALKEYFLEDISRTSSRIRLEGEFEHGFVLKNFPGSKPFKSTLKVLQGDIDGLVFVYNVFKLDSSHNRTTCRKDRDVLYVKSRYVEGEFSENCSHAFLERHTEYPLQDDEMTISYTRRENSTSRFELTLTAFTDPPCGEKFECGNKFCVSAEMRCDGRNNCGDGSDEIGCNGTCADGSLYPGCNSPDYCGDLFDESGCMATDNSGDKSDHQGSNATDNSRDGSDGKEGTDAAGYKPSTGFYIFLYVALSIVLVVCLAYIGTRWPDIFKKCCKRRTDTEFAWFIPKHFSMQLQ